MPWQPQPQPQEVQSMENDNMNNDDYQKCQYKKSKYDRYNLPFDHNAASSSGTMVTPNIPGPSTAKNLLKHFKQLNNSLINTLCIVLCTL